MQELEQMIEIYHTGYLVCLVLAVLFLALSVFLFFKFDIRRIVDMKTGRGAKKSIKKMEEVNARTGKLRQDMVADTPSILKGEDRVAYPKTEPNLQIHRQAHVTNHTANQMTNHETVRTMPSVELENVSETTVLNEFPETSLLYDDPGTTVLSENPFKNSQVQKRFPGTFKIEKEIILIETKEVL